MLSNLHTHTIFCDGKNTAEELVQTALSHGFVSLGFSAHATTPFDMRYCIKDIPGYMAEINRLKEKYAGQIQIYLGMEEDARAPIRRADYEYIIGSCHYMELNGEKYPIDSSLELFQKTMDVFENDPLRVAESYYQYFTAYILSRKPDIVGHFDLLTKYEQVETTRFLNNPQYIALAEKYLLQALQSGSLFEVNTGAIARGLRTSPYPAENLLHLLLKNGGEVVLNSDCHYAHKLTFAFDETRALLKDIGFTYVRILLDGEFKKDYL